MANMILSDLITEVQNGLGNRVDVKLTQARLIAGLNIAQQRLSRFYDYQELNKDLLATGPYTGVPAADKFLPLPAGIRSIHSLILQDLANSRKLKEKPWRMFDNSIPLVEYLAPGWPMYYTRFGVSYVMVYPAPQQAFSYFMRATILATAFTSSNLNATSDFVDKDDILIYWTLEYFFRNLGRPDLADEYDKMALGRANEAKATDENRPDMDASVDDMRTNASGPYWASPFVKVSP